MVKEKNFNIMCTEVLKILEYCPQSDIDKIPKKIITLFKENSDKNFQPKIDSNKSIFEQNISEESLVMMFIIYRYYWATEDEKIEFDKILKENEINLNKIYNYDNLFKNNNNNNIKTNNEFSKINSEENLSLIKYNKNIFEKIINIIKKLFKKN